VKCSTGLVALLLLIEGCAVGAHIRFRQDALRPVTLRVPDQASGCDLRFDSVRDRRGSSTAGALHGRPILDAQLAPWLRESLSKSGLTRPQAEQGLGLTLDITKAYGQDKHTAMSFTTLLRVERDGRIFRARGTHTVGNFAFGEGEVSRALLRSVERATLDLLDQLGRACSADPSR
jgi:hypothetical protein